MPTIQAANQHESLTPIQRALAIVDPRTGIPTPYFVELLQEVQRFVNGESRVIPCNASGTNTITLTPLSISPLLGARYVSHEIFSFVAENDSTGPVDATVRPPKGTLPTIKVYVDGGATQADAGDVLAGRFYLGCFVDGLDSGSGGLVLK